MGGRVREGQSRRQGNGDRYSFIFIPRRHCPPQLNTHTLRPPNPPIHRLPPLTSISRGRPYEKQTWLSSILKAWSGCPTSRRPTSMKGNRWGLLVRYSIFVVAQLIDFVCGRGKRGGSAAVLTSNVTRSKHSIEAI